MHNITLSIQDDILKAGREYSKKHNISLNTLLRKLLAKTVMRPANTALLEESFRLSVEANANSHGKKWSREELYDV